LALAGVGLGRPAWAQSTKPNIVFIMADDLGYADVSCYGQRDYTTPNIDRLAIEGLKFTQGYANSPVCSATRVALITGRYQYRLPVGLEEPIVPSSPRNAGLPSSHPTLPSLLKRVGYGTALVGKWHLGPLDGAADYFNHGANALRLPDGRAFGQLYERHRNQSGCADQMPAMHHRGAKARVHFWRPSHPGLAGGPASEERAPQSMATAIVPFGQCPPGQAFYKLSNRPRTASSEVSPPALLDPRLRHQQFYQLRLPLAVLTEEVTLCGRRAMPAE
jgi:sulfatase-like protein